MKRLTPAIKQEVRKQVGRLKWTYADANQAEMVALAELGQSNAVIRRDCHFSDNEISFALRKSQQLRGLKGGYRRAWANGESDVCKQVKADLLAVLRKEIQRTLPPKINIAKTIG